MSDELDSLNSGRLAIEKKKKRKEQYLVKPRLTDKPIKRAMKKLVCVFV